MRRARQLIPALALLVCSTPCWAGAPDPTGRWVLPSGKVRVEISHCGGAICARIIETAAATSGSVRRDEKNPDPSLRARPLVGVEVLHGLVPKGAEWSGGWIYNPGDGRRYDARAVMKGDDRLQVQGCVAILCKAQVWTRVR